MTYVNFLTYFYLYHNGNYFLGNIPATTDSSANPLLAKSGVNLAHKWIQSSEPVMEGEHFI